MNNRFFYEYFGIVCPPFGISPQPDFFYGGASREDYLRELIHFVRHGEGIAIITGEVGSGKTMEISMLLRKLANEKDFVIVLINSSMQNLDELIRAIALQLDINEQEHLRFQIEKKLIMNFAKGVRTLVIIDEAQYIPKEGLEFIRLLSNLETPQGKMLQVLLAGQPEILTTLAEFDMRAFCDRITLHIPLRELNDLETRSYIDHRLRLAGYRGDSLFNDSAIKLISEYSKGLSRRIHLLADKSLMAAYVESCRVVNVEHVKKAIDDSFDNKKSLNPDIYKPNKSSNNLLLISKYKVASLILIPLSLVFAIFGTYKFFTSNSNPSPQVLPQSSSPTTPTTQSQNPNINHQSVVSTQVVVPSIVDNSKDEYSKFPYEIPKASEKVRVINTNLEEKTTLSEVEIQNKLAVFNRKINWQLPENSSQLPNTVVSFRNSQINLANVTNTQWAVRIYSQVQTSFQQMEELIIKLQKVTLPENHKLVIYRYENYLRAIVTGYESQAQANEGVYNLASLFRNHIPTQNFYSQPIKHLFALGNK